MNHGNNFEDSAFEKDENNIPFFRKDDAPPNELTTNLFDDAFDETFNEADLILSESIVGQASQDSSSLAGVEHQLDDHPLDDHALDVNEIDKVDLTTDDLLLSEDDKNLDWNVNATLEPIKQAYERLGHELEQKKQAIANNEQIYRNTQDKLSALSSNLKRSVNEEPADEEHNLDLHRNMVRMDDCQAIIEDAHKIGEHVHNDIDQVEVLLTSLGQNVELLKMRIRKIRLLESLLDDQKSLMALHDKNKQAADLLQRLQGVLDLS